MQEQEGVIVHWDDQKGFGFILSNNNKKNYFHISAMRGAQRPEIGNSVLFVAGADAQGRPAAIHVRHRALVVDNPQIRVKPKSGGINPAKTEVKPATSRQRFRLKESPVPWGTLIPLLVLPFMGVINIAIKYGAPWGLVIYVCASMFAYYFYWDDKRRAKKKEWRIPEANLQFWSLIGGWPGAFIAQQQFRHKTKKIPFQIVFWLIVIAHQVLWFDWLFMDGQWLASLLLVQQGQ